MSINTGGPAFPCPSSKQVTNHPGWQDAQEGLSLRDWFAGQALRGAADIVCDELEGDDREAAEARAAIHATRHAMAAYVVADAMLKAREEQS